MNTIVRRVRVDRSRTAKEALAATGRSQYVTDSVIEAMPKGEGEEVDVHFFKLKFKPGRIVSDDYLEKEYALRGFKPADPYSQAAVNEADPAFADRHRNGTYWKDINGKWCYAVFDHRNGLRGVFIRCFSQRQDFLGVLWFAGLQA